MFQWGFSIFIDYLFLKTSGSSLSQMELSVFFTAGCWFDKDRDNISKFVCSSPNQEDLYLTFGVTLKFLGIEADPMIKWDLGSWACLCIKRIWICVYESGQCWIILQVYIFYFTLASHYGHADLPHCVTWSLAIVLDLVRWCQQIRHRQRLNMALYIGTLSLTLLLP